MLILPWILKGAAFAGAAVVSQKALNKGGELLEQAGGLSGVGEGAQDLLSNLDVFDFFGTKRAKHEAELEEHQAEREHDIKSAKAREKALKAQQAAQLKALKAQQKRDLQAVKEGAHGDVARLEASLRELEARHTRELQAATSRTDKAIAATKLRNVRALQTAAAQAAQPSAVSQLRELVHLAADLVHRDGVAPDAALFAQQGVEAPSLETLLEEQGATAGYEGELSGCMGAWRW